MLLLKEFSKRKTKGILKQKKQGKNPCFCQHLFQWLDVVQDKARKVVWVKLTVWLLKSKRLAETKSCATDKQKNALVKTNAFLFEINYLFENWGARRAFFKPYFFLSFILESLVKKPAFLSAALVSGSACKSARAIP